MQGRKKTEGRMEENKQQKEGGKENWKERRGKMDELKQTYFIPSLIFQILPQVQRLLSCSYLKTADCLPVISLDVSLIFPSFHSTAHTDFTPATPVRWTQSANTSHWLPLWAAMSGEGLIDMRLNIVLSICHLIAHWKM